MILVSADAGKCNTKSCLYNPEKTDQFPYGYKREYKRRTRMSPGDFRDDAFTSGTLIAKVDDGEVCRIGRDAIRDPEHVTSKMQEVHRTSILTAIARNLGPGEFTDVTACVSIPFDEAKSVDKRIAFKEFVFGREGTEHCVTIKDSPESQIFTTKFRCNTVRVYPEGAGIIYEYPLRFMNGINAAIDIGQQNANCIYVNNSEIDYEKSFTTNWGFTYLVSELMGRLSREFTSELDENVVLNAIAGTNAYRMLPLRNPELAERSNQVINECIHDYIDLIRQQMLEKRWPVDFMNFTFFGGVPNIIKDDLKVAFGDEQDDSLAIPEKRLLIPKDSDMINARGMLHMAASRNQNMNEGLNMLMPLPESAQ